MQVEPLSCGWREPHSTLVNLQVLLTLAVHLGTSHTTEWVAEGRKAEGGRCPVTTYTSECSLVQVLRGSHDPDLPAVLTLV